jgi:hypothetical protein
MKLGPLLSTITGQNVPSSWPAVTTGPSQNVPQNVAVGTAASRSVPTFVTSHVED